MSQYTWRIDFKIGYPESNENYFYVTFRQSREYLQMAEKETKTVSKKVTEKVSIRVTDKVTTKVTERVTEKQMIILKEIIKNKFITTKQLSVVVGISERKIKENIKKLKNKEVLKRVGPDRGGYWEITSE